MKKRRILTVLSSLLIFMSACGPKDYTGAYDLGVKSLKENDYNTALASFLKAKEDSELEVESSRMIGITYLKMGDYKNAVTYLDDCRNKLRFKSEEFECDVMYYLAEACEGSGDTKRAIKLYSRLIKEHDDADASFMRGRIYLGQNEEKKAKADFKASLAKNPGYDNYIRVYLIYAGNNREADGAAYLEEAVKKEPRGAEEQYEQGRILYYLQDYDNASKVLKEAVDEGVDEAVWLLGQIYLKNQNQVSARKLYQRYLDENKDSAAAYNGLALCDIADKNYDDALSDIQTGLEKADNKDKENLLFNEIVVYENKLDFKTAKEKMNVFVQQYPENETAVRENLFLQSR